MISEGSFGDSPWGEPSADSSGPAVDRSRRRDWSLTQRMLVLPAVFLGGLVAVLAVSAWLDRQVREGVFFPRIEREIIEAQQSTLKTLVDLEAQELGAAIQGLGTEAEKLAVIDKDTDPLRFFADRSGYFFTYRFDGVCINSPVNRARNGKNALDATDPNGVRYIEELIKVARDGGGFVNYSFEKPGAGVQPKLSYACRIPGTDAILGAGVYMDHVQAEVDGVRSEVGVLVRRYQLILLGLSALMGAVTVGASIWIARRIVGYLRVIGTRLDGSARQVDDVARQVAESSQTLASGVSEQAASLEETSASLEEMASMTRRNSESVVQVTTLGRQAREAAERGAQDMGAMSQAMEAIQTSSRDIEKILHTI
ncbi:MAG: cache domain-containing protein, partial [Verrucomicrobiales bacterium]|nr:cache domain-containing protein [Verrucomicrobiales bacterium]